MDKKDWEAEQTCYRTGFTQPKIAKRGPLAILLVLIIFFGGLNTACRLLNIRKFLAFSQNAAVAPASVQFSRGKSGKEQTPGLPALGMTGKEISAFEHQYYRIPTGFYVTKIVPGSAAETAGILPGDVLTCFDGVATPDLDTLKAQLYSCAAGEQVSLTLYRKGAYYSVAVYLDEAQ